MSFFFGFGSRFLEKIVYNIFFFYSPFLHPSQIGRGKMEEKEKEKERKQKKGQMGVHCCLSLYFCLLEAFVQAQLALSSYRGSSQFLQQIITSLGLLSPNIEVKNQVKAFLVFAILLYPFSLLTLLESFWGDQIKRQQKSQVKRLQQLFSSLLEVEKTTKKKDLLGFYQQKSLKKQSFSY